MLISSKYFTTAVISAVTIIANAQKQPQIQNYNGTILQLLNDTTISPAIKFSEFLYNSSDYQSIINILNNTNQNVTFFLPSDQVYYTATGESPSTNSNSSQTNSSSTAAVATSVASGTQTSSAAAATGAIGNFFSSIMGAQNSQTATAATSQIPAPTATQQATGTASMTNIVLPPAVKVKPFTIAHKSSGWDSVTTDAAFADKFSYLDLMYYHLVNGSVNLDSANSTLILNTLLTNQSVVKNGKNAPLVAQQSNLPNNTASASNWTVGSGLGDGAQINQTFQTTNGIIYVINKILVPPINASDTVKQIDQMSYFTWLLNQANVSLDSSSNFTVFAPVNEVIQNISLIGLSNQTLQNLVRAHIVPGTYYTSNVTSGNPVQIKSTGGSNITLSKSNNNVTLNNNIHVIKPNILMNNGVLHIIDGVLNYTVAGLNNGNGNNSSSSSNSSTTGGTTSSTVGSSSSISSSTFITSSSTISSSGTSTSTSTSGGSSFPTGSSNNGNGGQTAVGGAFPVPSSSAVNNIVESSNLIFLSAFVYLCLQFF